MSFIELIIFIIVAGAVCIGLIIAIGLFGFLINACSDSGNGESCSTGCLIMIIIFVLIGLIAC